MKRGLMISLVLLSFALVAAGAVARVVLVYSDHHPTKIGLSAEGAQEGETLLLAWQQSPPADQGGDKGVTTALAIRAGRVY